LRTTPGWSRSCTTCCSSSSGRGEKDLSAPQAKALLAKVRPPDAAGKARRRVTAELIADVERTDARKKTADKELRELIETTGTSLLTLNGIGPSGAARLLIDVGDITRFPTKGHFAPWNGTAPLDASSGDQIRHRLSRAGNRQINRTLHTIWRPSSCATPPRTRVLRPDEGIGQDVVRSDARPQAPAVRHRLPAHS
jgi:transposase